MQVIIDIDEYEYKRVKELVSSGLFDYEGITPHLFKSVANSTPLPKGHGRLIDADKVIKTMNCYMLDINKTHTEKYVMSVAKDMVIIEPTIIEADREVKE